MDSLAPIESRTVEAFRHLCELIHHPTARRLEQAADHDWAAFPEVRRILAGGDWPVSPESAGAATRELLVRSVEELRPAYPVVDGRLSALEVIERHLIDGYSWDAITTECIERGYAVSERTLRSRQREGLEAVLRRLAATETERSLVPGQGDSTFAAGASPRPGARRGSVLAIAALLVAAIWIGVGVSGGTKDASVPLGQVVGLRDGRTALGQPYPAWDLPVIGSPLERGIVVEPEPGEPRLLLAAAATGPDAGLLLLYDPRRDRIEWQDRLVPDPEEIGAAARAEPGAHLEVYRAEYLVYGHRSLNLGATAVVVYVQRYRPCFVVEYDLRTGERLGQYYHPGRLENAMVADVDADGQPEVYLGGQDNVLDRPVLVRLRPGLVRGAASTAFAAEGRTTEGACLRVILPAIPALEREWGVKRLQVANGASHRWDPEKRLVSFDVGANNNVLAYRVRLDADLRPLPEASISVGEGPARVWREVGLDPTSTADLVARIERVEGTGRAELSSR